MESCMVLKIIGVSKYDGMSRNGKPYSLYTLELDFHGEKCKIKTFESEAHPGDYAQLSIGTRKTIYGAEFAVNVDKIITKDEIENNWK